ncbi:MAG: glycosyltransferase [Betaproteobacteria bacterium]
MSSGLWAPTGVPTIYNLINFFDRSPDYSLELLVISKSEDPNAGFAKLFKRIKLEGLQSEVRFVGFQGLLNIRFGKALREVLHLVVVSLRIAIFRPNVVYIDHANLIAAAFIARYLPIPVIFRLMGVYPAMRDVLDDHRRVGRFLKWCYQSPFTLVICTQDGSGVERWLERAISPDVVVHRLVNGADYRKANLAQLELMKSFYKIPEDKIKILFVGKLEKIKGIFEFLEGFRLASENCEYRLHAIIIGYGDQFAAVNDYIERHDLQQYITLIDRLPHKDIYCFHEISDIYVSTNRLANLTNANLEAIASGQCIIIPKSQKETGVDLITDKLLSENSVFRIDFPPTGPKLCKALCYLICNPAKRLSLSKNVKSESSEFIDSWGVRVEREINLIESILVKNG